MIQYDADGQAVALPRAVLLQKGFAAGKMYYKGKDQEAKQVWKLLSVSEEGTCDFCLLTHTGSESAQHLEMNAAGAASKFRPWNKEFEYLLDPIDLRRKADFKKDVVAGRVLDALLVLAESLPDAPVRVQLKPYKCLRATQDIEARGLQLAPLTKAVSIINGAGGPKQTICTLAHGDGTETKCILGAGPVKPEECVFFWSVQGTSTAEEANVVAEEFQVHVVAPTRGQPQDHDQPQAEGLKSILRVPCWVNPEVIKKDAEIQFFREKAKQQAVAKEPRLTFAAVQRGRSGAAAASSGAADAGGGRKKQLSKSGGGGEKQLSKRQRR